MIDTSDMGTKRKPNHTILIVGIALFVISRITSFIDDVSTLVLTYVGIGMIIYDLLPRTLIGNPAKTAETVPITNQAFRRVRLGIMLLLVAVPLQLFISIATAWSGSAIPTFGERGFILLYLGLILFTPASWFLIKGYTARFTAVENFHVWSLTFGLLLVWFELAIADLYRMLLYPNPEPIYLQRSFILGLSALIIFSTFIHIYVSSKKDVDARLPDKPPPPPNNG